jgi:HAMP domain-containing protein
MTLRTRLMLRIITLLVVAVLLTASVLTLTARESLLAQTTTDGKLQMQQFAIAASFGQSLSALVDGMLTMQMVAIGKTIAQYVSNAEQNGLTTDEINAQLKAIAGDTALQIWITDEQGRVYLSNTDQRFTFSEAEVDNPQIVKFLPLLSGEKSFIVWDQPIDEQNPSSIKYIGVPGIDKPRIVQVAFAAPVFGMLAQRNWQKQMHSQMVNKENVNAIWLIDPDLTVKSFTAFSGATISEELSDSDRARLAAARDNKSVDSYLDGDYLKIIGPQINPLGIVTGLTMSYIPTWRVQETLNRQILLTGIVALVVLLWGIGAILLLSRRITQPISQLTTASQALEKQAYKPAMLESMLQRPDELGQLARMFHRMASEIITREESLKQQVIELRIEIDEAKKAKQVAEVTETQYFQDLHPRAKELRTRPKIDKSKEIGKPVESGGS